MINEFESQLSLLDIVEFIQESWKIIASVTVLGIAGAALYLWVVPNQYEVVAQIKLAQLANVNGNNINPIGANIEEPQSLLARMALPSSYPKETLALCGLADQKDAQIALVRKVKFSIPKGVGGTVDLKLRDISKDTAVTCADAVYQLIKTYQDQLIAPYIDDAKKKLVIERERLSRANQLITMAHKSGEALNATYFATRDEIRFLLDQISSLQTFIIGNENRAAFLTAPIFLNDQPVFPKKGNSFLIGSLLGCFLGLVLALAQKWYRSKRLTLKR